VCSLAVKHSGPEADDENSEVRKANSIVVTLTAANDHAIQSDRRYRQAAQAVPHFGNISVVDVVALTPIHVAANETTLRPKVSFLRDCPPVRTQEFIGYTCARKCDGRNTYHTSPSIG
jgi:hypothetical protein